MLHQFEKSAAVVVTFRLGIIARKIHNGSNDSKLYLFKIFSCKLFSNHFIFNRQNFILTSFSFLSTNFCNEYEIGGQLELSILPAIVYDTSKLFPTFFHLLK